MAYMDHAAIVGGGIQEMTLDEIDNVNGGNYYGDTLEKMGGAIVGVGAVFGQPELITFGAAIGGGGALINLVENYVKAV